MLSEGRHTCSFAEVARMPSSTQKAWIADISENNKAKDLEISHILDFFKILEISQ